MNIPIVRFVSDEWFVRQTFSKYGESFTVFAWGRTRSEAFGNLEQERKCLETSEQTTLDRVLCWLCGFTLCNFSHQTLRLD